jgi:hypothetical protein
MRFVGWESEIPIVIGTVKTGKTEKLEVEKLEAKEIYRPQS